MAIGERHLFSWLHLSDLHFGHGSVGYQWDQKRVLKLMMEDVTGATVAWPELPGINAIMITGDVAFSGNEQEYADATEWLKTLTGRLQVDHDNVYIVPGNHDVQRAPRGQGIHPLVEAVRDGSKTLDDLLNDAGTNAELLKRQENFTTFNKGFGSRSTEGWVQTLPIEGLGDLRIVGLNTAMLSADNRDQGNLHLAQRHRALLAHAENITILLTHHPDQGQWLADEVAVQSVVRNQTHIHLSGHTHDPRMEVFTQSGGSQHVRVVAAAAHTDENERYSHGYNFASLMVRADGQLVLRVWPRRWFPEWDGFRVDHRGVQDRSFWDEKLLGQELTGSGLVLEPPEKLQLVGVHWWGNPPVHWRELLAGRDCLEVFGVAVGTLFGEDNIADVKDFLEAGGSVRVVMADPRQKTAMARYDEDFNKPLGDRTHKVLEVIERLWKLRESLQVPDRLSVRLIGLTFKYSAYRLDGEVLFVPYAMNPGKRTKKTPALVARKGGTWLTEFLGPDLDALLERGVELTPSVFEQVKGKQC